MCGRYVAASKPADIAAYFDAQPDDDLDPEPSWNVAPTSDVLVVGERLVEDTGDRHRAIQVARWGLVPFWAKDPSIGNRMINARAESVGTSNAYKRSFQRRRCIVPADAFYEWTKREGQQRKQPWLIRRRDGKPLAFAGLWDTWKDAEGHRLRSCVIITCPANDEIVGLHDRMPVILGESDWADWLDPANHDTPRLQDLLVPAPTDLLELFPVSTDVNNVRNDAPELADPIDLD
jgi:putative SOS response-associated peptidase YedK